MPRAVGSSSDLAGFHGTSGTVPPVITVASALNPQDVRKDPEGGSGGSRPPIGSDAPPGA